MNNILYAIYKILKKKQLHILIHTHTYVLSFFKLFFLLYNIEIKQEIIFEMVNIKVAGLYILF